MSKCGWPLPRRRQHQSWLQRAVSAVQISSVMRGHDHPAVDTESHLVRASHRERLNAASVYDVLASWLLLVLSSTGLQKIKEYTDLNRSTARFKFAGPPDARNTAPQPDRFRRASGVFERLASCTTGAALSVPRKKKLALARLAHS